MIYFFNASGACIQVMQTQGGNEVDLYPLIARQRAVLPDCVATAIAEAAYAMGDVCWWQGEMRVRTGCPAAVDVTGHLVTITDLPNPAIVEVEGTPYLVEDGIAEITLDLPGPYTITVQALPYRDATFAIEIAP